MANVISFPARPIPGGQKHKKVRSQGLSVNPPATHLRFWLATLPVDLVPEMVARDVLARGSREAALPVWANRLGGFRDHLSSRSIRGDLADRLIREWREMVRVEGLMQMRRPQVGGRGGDNA